MAIPWLRILNAALGLSEIVGKVGRPASAALSTAAPADRGTGAPIETKLAGVVVAALKEAFDRDRQRIQLERELRDADRKRAEVLLRLEMVRQAGDREIARLRGLAAIALIGWLGTLLPLVVGGSSPVLARAIVGAGWALLLGALGASFLAQGHVSAALARLREAEEPPDPTTSAASAVAPWLLLAGLALSAAGVLIR